MTVYPVVHYKTGGMDPFQSSGALVPPEPPSREGLIADGLTRFYYATMVDGFLDS